MDIDRLYNVTMFVDIYSSGGALLLHKKVIEKQVTYDFAIFN